MIIEFNEISPKISLSVFTAKGSKIIYNTEF